MMRFAAFFVILLHCSLVSSSGAEDEVNVLTGVPRVKVKVLEESLCPGCKMFVETQLVPVYESLGATIIDLQVIPFGNARFVPRDDDPGKKVLECQHGPAECDANSYEQCVALMLYPYPQRYLPFLQCLYEDLPTKHGDENFDRSFFAGCARKSALDWENIAACHDDENQAAALQQVAYALTPDYHEYVPWIEVNGLHIEMEDDKSFIQAVCKAYTESGGSSPFCDPEIGTKTTMF
jgi:interferon gamma-inducible protein 30